MVSQHDRTTLHLALEEHLGKGPAATLMELLPPVEWADLARRSDVVALRGELRGEIAELRGEIGQVRGEMAELRAELRGDMAELRGDVRREIEELRGDVRALLPKFIATNVPLMFATAGLVLAAAKLA